MAKKYHQDNSGKPATNRAKPPHKGGYHGRMKGVNPKKVWFELDGKKCPSPWNPGKH